MLRWERERKGEARLLTLHRLELNIRTPGRGVTGGQGGLRGATGKNGWLLFKNLKPRAEGSETEIFTKFAFLYPVNLLACMRKPLTFYTLTVWVIARDKASTRRLTTAILHGTSPWGEQCSADAVAEVEMEKSTNDRRLGQKNRNRRASMAASWRQKNLRSRWRISQYKVATWVRQGRLSRHQPMNKRDSIRASDNRYAQGRSQSVKSSRSVEWTYDREQTNIMFYLQHVSLFGCVVSIVSECVVKLTKLFS